jgi:hypothetical protein
MAMELLFRHRVGRDHVTDVLRVMTMDFVGKSPMHFRLRRHTGCERPDRGAMFHDLTVHGVNIAHDRQEKGLVSSVTVATGPPPARHRGRAGRGMAPREARYHARMTSEGVPGSASGAGRQRRDVPPPLQVAAALAGLEAFLLGVQAVSLMPSLDEDRIAMGVTTVVFFLVYGAALGWCAWQLRRLQSWARSPVVFAQLIQLGVAWSFRGDPTTFVAVALAASALLVLAGVFHPQSLRALAE